MNCRICNEKAEVYKKVKKGASNVSVLFDSPTKVHGVDFDVYRCRACNHYQIIDIANDDYYDDYVMSSSYTDSIVAICNEQCQQLKHDKPDATSLVDIGCGDGGFMVEAKKYFKHIVGYEPSKAFTKIARSRKCTVINEYVDKKTNTDKKYDVLVSRQVFEHLPNPSITLKIIKNLLIVGGVGVIEVPNGQKIIDDDRYFDIFSDHLNYYTPFSLSRLIEGAGLHVTSIRASLNGGDYLEIYFKKMEEKKSKKFENRFDNLILEKIKESKKKNIAIWGAGAKSQSFFTAIGDKLNPALIIDSDSHKTGKYLPNTTVPISKPNPDLILVCDLVVIFSLSYTEEIKKYLKSIGYTKHVIAMDPFPKLLKL